MANNVTNSDADVISIRGAAAGRDERVPDGSLPLLSPPSRQFPSSCDNNLGNKGGRGSASLFHSSRPNHLILNVIVFLSFPVSLRLQAARSQSLPSGGNRVYIQPNRLKDCWLFWMEQWEMAPVHKLLFFWFFLIFQSKVTQDRMTLWTLCEQVTGNRSRGGTATASYSPFKTRPLPRIGGTKARRKSAALKPSLLISGVITAASCNTKSHCNKSAVKNLIEWRVNVKVIMRR